MVHKSVLVGTVSAVFALQVLVPLAALVHPDKPNRLGWQMYSGTGGQEIIVTGPDGARIEVVWSDIVAKSPRPELDWTHNLPEHLCSHVAEAEITVSVGASRRTVTC